MARTGTKVSKHVNDAEVFNTRRIRELEASGDLDPDCQSCRADHYPVLERGEVPFAPRHRASNRCESGKRPHCTCDVCF